MHQNYAAKEAVFSLEEIAVSRVTAERRKEQDLFGGDATISGFICVTPIRKRQRETHVFFLQVVPFTSSPIVTTIRSPWIIARCYSSAPELGQRLR
jgi:hypothetical protein